MADVVRAFQEQRFSFADVVNYTQWYHAEDILDKTVHKAMQQDIDSQWHARFSSRDNDDMSQMPAYLQEEAKEISKGGAVTVTTAGLDKRAREALAEDGRAFKRKYLADVQRIFCRVQHHMHRLTKKGRVPLKGCLRKQGKACKHGFPKSCFKFAKATLICRGIARRFAAAGIRISGRRNAFGSFLLPRGDAWQSASTPSFAVAFRSNTHTAPNWRLPPMPGTHEEELCRSRTCHEEVRVAKNLYQLSKIAQRSQRNCTGYFCGYTFKAQPVGKKFIRGIAESLNYMTVGLQDQTPGKQWHRITHRLLTDLQHRSMRRTAPEEWNLAAYYQEHDPTTAEFVRTYMSVDFKGGLLLKRLEAETKHATSREILKVLPSTSSLDGEAWLQHFDDLYGYRGSHESVFFLNPWEFTSLWEVVCVSTCPAIAATEKDRVAYPKIPGAVQLRENFYMKRRKKPMVPAPSGTPMPEKAKTADAKARLYCVYLRPWVLDAKYATVEVPHITQLDVVPARRLRGKQSDRTRDSACKRSYVQWNAME